MIKHKGAYPKKWRERLCLQIKDDRSIFQKSEEIYCDSKQQIQKKWCINVVVGKSIGRNIVYVCFETKDYRRRSWKEEKEHVLRHKTTEDSDRGREIHQDSENTE